jgi:hypothetical protein
MKRCLSPRHVDDLEHAIAPVEALVAALALALAQLIRTHGTAEMLGRTWLSTDRSYSRLRADRFKGGGRAGPAVGCAPLDGVAGYFPTRSDRAAGG